MRLENPGFAGVGSVGYGFGNGFRAEVEGNYRSNDVHSFSGVPTHASGYESNSGIMLNGLYDINVGSKFVTPYVGAGLGWQHSDFNNVSAKGSGVALRSDNSNNDLAYQGIAGASFPTSINGLSVTAEYRLRGNVEDGTSYKAVEYTSSGSKLVKLSGDNGLNHSMLVGLRYAFNTPVANTMTSASLASAMPAVERTPASARTYLIFFDWDSATLSDRARSIVDDAALNAHTGVTKIDVSGHTDTSGKASYNQGLSERRANAVADALVSKGVARNTISVHAYGDTQPVVATGPGVREVQNRRVEIVFH
jgi:outer membrane protein OmpA-like peptidoglycan-associated protein